MKREDAEDKEDGDGKEYGKLRKMLKDMGGGWEQVQIQGKAKYLGFHVGPERNASVWDKARQKWEARTSSWTSKELGLQPSALVYNTFCVSVLGFLSQLLEVPRTILDREEYNMLKLASGPKAWANASDLWNMGKQFSIGRSFDCIQAKAQAGKLRAI